MEISTRLKRWLILLAAMLVIELTAVLILGGLLDDPARIWAGVMVQAQFILWALSCKPHRIVLDDVTLIDVS